MPALIYDTTTQAFKDAETPKIYSSGDGAYVDAHGKIWDENAQAWVDAWVESGPPGYLYYQGNECKNITGGWEGTGKPVGGWDINGTLVKGSSSMTLTADGTGYSQASIYYNASTNNMISLTAGQKVHLYFDSITTTGFNVTLILSKTDSGNGIYNSCVGSPADQWNAYRYGNSNNVVAGDNVWSCEADATGYMLIQIGTTPSVVQSATISKIWITNS